MEKRREKEREERRGKKEKENLLEENLSFW